MEVLLSLDLSLFVDEVILFLGNYGFVIVILFGIAHPILENPLALFNLTLAIALLGTAVGYIVVFVSNLIGILILYYLVMKVKNHKNKIFLKKNV